MVLSASRIAGGARWVKSGGLTRERYCRGVRGWRYHKLAPVRVAVL